MPTDTLQIAFEAIDKGLEKQINAIDADLTKLEKQIDSTNKSAGNFGLSAEQIGSKMASAGKALTIGLTVPIAGLAVAATKAASDLNETSNKIETLFGNATGAVMKFADTAATSLGQSKKQALDAAADFAVFGKAAGLAGNDLVDFSKKNVQLAADMASFFNTSPEEAITAIGAAFRGESEPIRRYGVLINEASLKDQALRMGLIKTTTEALQPQQRVLAAQALILQQTSAAQGDFAKTSDGLANQSRILNAQFQDMIASLGQSLLPVAVKVAGAANDLLTAFNNLDQPQKDLIVGFGLMAAAAGPVLTVSGKLISVFGVMRNVSIDAVGGFVTFGKTVGETAGYLKTVGLSADSLKFAFQNLKASGALLTAELGVIVIGLIAIGKYLEEVGNAAKASSEDLIEMSRSGDVFKQAAATTEIFAHGQDRLKVALDGTHEKIRQGAKDYADYKSSIEATAKASGYEINAAGDLVQVYYGMGGRIEKVIEAHYRLSKAQYDAVPGANQLVVVWNKLVDVGKQFVDIVAPASSGALIPLAQNYGVLTGAISRAQAAGAEANIVWVDASAKMGDLRAAMSGAVEKELTQFNEKQDALKAKAAELQDTISTSYGKARDSAVTSLNEINGQLATNAAAHEDATRRILFGYAEQQLAIGGLTETEFKALDALAVQWGLKSKEDIAAMQAIRDAAAGLAKDDSIDKFVEKISKTGDKAIGIQITPQIDYRKLREEKAEKAISIPVIPKIDMTSSAKIARDLAGDLKYAQPVISPKVDTKAATTDITALVTNVYSTVPKDKSTVFKADTVTATRNTNDILKLFSVVPKTTETAINVDGKLALQTLDDVLRAFGLITDKSVTVTVKYKQEGEPPEGFQRGGSYIVPPNPRGGAGDYFPVLAAPGERVTVQTKAQQNTTPALVQGGDTYNYTTNVYNPLAAAMLADKQRRDRLARSNARMGVA